MTTRADSSFKRWSVLALLVMFAMPMNSQTSSDRPRARQAGVIVGSLPPGPLNAITDVAGVRVGHTTLREGDSIRTGVTVIVPHAGNVFEERVPAAIHVGNGFGKLLGVTQVRELGELETPILLTSTLSVWQAADALVAWLLAQAGHERRSLHQPGRGRNQRWLSQRHPRATHSPRACHPRAGERREWRRRGRRGGGRHGDGGVRLERRHRHQFAQAARDSKADTPSA